jgi:hypothetical protein
MAIIFISPKKGYPWLTLCRCHVLIITKSLFSCFVLMTWSMAIIFISHLMAWLRNGKSIYNYLNHRRVGVNRKVGASLRSGTESRGQTVGVDRKVRVGSRDCNFTSKHTPILPAELHCFASMLIKLSSLSSSSSLNIYILIVFHETNWSL